MPVLFNDFDHRAGAEILEGLEGDGGRGTGLLAREACRPADRVVDADVSAVHGVGGRIRQRLCLSFGTFSMPVLWALRFPFFIMAQSL
jgi:hypothetical protein